MIRQALLAVLLLSAGTGAAARTLIVGANGYGLTASGKWVRFSRLLLDDDGRVAEQSSGNGAEPALAAGDFRFDAGGQTIVPGFVAASLPLMDYALSLSTADLSAAASLSAIESLLRRQLAQLPAGLWLRGDGLQDGGLQGEELLDNGATPRAFLDSLAGARPALLISADRQTGWANSAALRAAGIDSATANPSAGRIAHGADGQPSGLLQGSAVLHVLAAVPPPGAGARDAALTKALTRLAALGFTAVHDMGTPPLDWALYRNFGDEGRLSLRIVSYANGPEAMANIAPLRPPPPLYGGALRLSGIYFADDSPGSAVTDGQDSPDGSARQRNLFSRANYLGYQIAVRAGTAEALGRALDSFEAIAPAYEGRLANRIEGLRSLAEGDKERLAALHLIVSAPADDPACLGPALRAAGVRVVPLPGQPPASALATLAAATGSSCGRAGRLSVREAIAALTEAATRAGGDKESEGALSPGTAADFLLLSADPFRADKDAIGTIRIEETWVGGRRVFQRAVTVPAAGAPASGN